ncbi:UDP-glucose 4-epimerase [hydrothermal vent metagenome]|uniref:UDP-glucose 4-epimerase n=1 Tax=hydrothermal vent metagenome TaxID=652676 RepID=A0A3B0Z8N6_9ZZZZ
MTVSQVNFDGKTIFVTGATGFIGAHLCRKLKQLGARIHAVSRYRVNDAAYTWHQAELSNSDQVDLLLNQIKPHYVFHLAGLVKGARDESLVMPMCEANLLSSIHILSAASKLDQCRVILTGSLEEPGGQASAPIPSSPYAAAKYAASAYARMYRELYNLSVVTARLFMVYGPDQKDDKKLIPYVINNLLKNEQPNLMSGQREVDWIYVEDVVNGYIAIALQKSLSDYDIDIGSGELHTVQFVVDSLTDIIQPSVSTQFGSVPDRAMEQIRVANVSRTKELTGWSPEHSLLSGLEKTVKWYKGIPSV